MDLPTAPDPVACEQDSDCVVDFVVTQDGCCRAVPIMPQNRAWQSWARESRASEDCQRVECRPLPQPYIPE